jgi:hypothetical protein
MVPVSGELCIPPQTWGDHPPHHGHRLAEREDDRVHRDLAPEALGDHLLESSVHARLDKIDDMIILYAACFPHNRDITREV